MNSLWIHYLFREYTINSLYDSRSYYEFTMCFATLLLIHYLFLKYTILLTLTWIYFEFIF